VKSGQRDRERGWKNGWKEGREGRETGAPADDSGQTWNYLCLFLTYPSEEAFIYIFLGYVLARINWKRFNVGEAVRKGRGR
jgi:hypothetical protein